MVLGTSSKNTLDASSIEKRGMGYYHLPFLSQLGDFHTAHVDAYLLQPGKSTFKAATCRRISHVHFAFTLIIFLVCSWQLKLGQTLLRVIVLGPVAQLH